MSVVIPAFNEEATIRDTIESVKRQTYAIDRIVVVDDCSNDATGRIASEAGVEVVRTEKNVGSKAKAQNFGVNSIESEVFVSLDADTVLREDAIENVVSAFNDGKVFAVSGFVVPLKIRTIWERVRLVEYLLSFGLYKQAQNHWSVPLVASGCFSAFRTKSFKDLGGFPEDNIAEDMALTWKVLLRGFKVIYNPKAVCYAKDPENWQQYKRQVMRWCRGFYQCLSDFKLSLIHRPSLFVFTSVYLCLGIISSFWMFVVAYVALFTSGAISYLLVLTFVLDTLVGYSVVAYNGFQLGKFREAITGYPLLWFIGPISSAIFIWAMFREWLFHQRLSVWEKGH